jgi:FtsZ-binding cell division protein ZapB
VRLILAIQCFFAVLFGKAVPPKALPAPPEEPGKLDQLQKELAEAKERAESLQKDKDALQKDKDALQKDADALQADKDALSKEKGDLEAAKGKLAEELAAAKADAGKSGDLEAKLAEAEERVAKAKEDKEAAAGKLKEARDHGALALLAWLQREGRLIDFLREDIDDYEDEQVGAAVRAIHKGCLKVLAEGVELEAILDGEEEEPVTVEQGFDPVAISLTGNVKGDPPFKGTLMHKGWRAKGVSVPVPETVDPHVLAPAEVEL